MAKKQESEMVEGLVERIERDHQDKPSLVALCKTFRGILLLEKFSSNDEEIINLTLIEQEIESRSGLTIEINQEALKFIVGQSVSMPLKTLRCIGFTKLLHHWKYFKLNREDHHGP